MFEYRTSVITPFCDMRYYLSAEYSMHLVQETTGRMAAESGVDIPALLKEGKSWVILSATVDMFLKPYWKTPIVMEGYCYKPMGRFVPRRTICRLPDGSRAFQADSIWGVVSVEGGNVHRIIDPRTVTDRIEHDILDPDDAFHERFRMFDIASFPNLTEAPSRKVLFRDCDINGHMNNLRYVNWIFDNMPASAYDGGKDVKRLDMCFLKELHLGDDVRLRHADSGTGDLYASVNDAVFAKAVFGDVPRVIF